MLFTNFLSELLATLGGIVALLTAVGGVSYAFFKVFAEKWLTARFEKQASSIRHQQQIDFANFKFEMDRYADRAVKLNQREFEVLPTAWSKIFEAYSLTRSILGLESFPDLQALKPSQLEDYLQKSDLTDNQKQEIRESKDKNTYIQQHLTQKKFSAIGEKIRDAHIYVRQNSIFMPAELRGKFQAIEDLVWGAFVEQEVNRMPQRSKHVIDYTMRLLKEGAPLIEDLENALEPRLATFADNP
jgi:hypothetical protein